MKFILKVIVAFCLLCSISYAAETSQTILSKYLDVHEAKYHRVAIITCDVVQGDKLLVYGQLQVDNDLWYNIGMTFKLKWSHDNVRWHTVLGTTMGQNITPGMHHGTQTRLGIIEITRNWDKIWIALDACAYSDASTPGAKAPVKKVSIGCIKGR